MTAVDGPRTGRRSRIEWAIRAAWLLALLSGALQILAVCIAAGGVLPALSADPVTTTIETSQPLHSVGQNSYSGSAFVADDAPLSVTQVRAQVSDPATSVRIGLAFGPLAWALTGASVAVSLTFAFGRMVGARVDRRRSGRAFGVAALITAIGTSAGQILDEIARTGLHGVAWHGPNRSGELGVGDGFTFQFGWIAIAIGGLAVAAIVQRGSGPAPAGG